MASPAINASRANEGGSAPSEPQTASPARAALDVIAITIRDEFLLELSEALGGQASVTPVDSAAQALEHFRGSKRVQVLVVDSRDLANLTADVDTIQAQAPHIVMLVFAQADAEKQVAATLKGSNVFAVLPVPVDQRKTSAVFGGAVADAKARQATPRPTAPERSATIAVEVSPPAPAEFQSPIRPEPQDGGKSKLPLRAIGAGALVVLIAGAVWFFTRDEAAQGARKATPTVAANAGRAADAQPAIEAPAIETSLVKGKVDELLEKARLAMRERRYTEPSGDNALLYYRSAAAADKTNGEAIDGLARIGMVLAARFDEAMTASHFDEAATALAQLKIATPGDGRVAQFQERLTTAQITKALADDNLDRAAALVRAAQQSDALPADQLTKWRAEITRLQEEAKAKRLAEQQAAREAAAAEQKKARDARAAAEAEKQAQLAREKAREEKLKEEQAAAPAQQAAGATKAGSGQRSAASLQGSLKRKRYVAPEYPQNALAKRIGGAVTVEFVVNVDGETRDIKILSAEPANVFDRAAITAVKRWRYEPVLIDGVPTEVPTRMVIRFAPPE